ncbi:MAG: EamA family transporter [Bacteroidia bacterium]|nr:EamA family transporter [Bacteroidia bacterium]
MNDMIYVVISLLLVTTSQLMFKKGIISVEKSGPAQGGALAGILRMVFHPMVFGGLACNGLAAFFWLLALSKLDLSYIFPFLSLNYILIPAGAALFFGEKLSRYRIIGIVIICAGLFLIAFSEGT